MKRIKLYRVGRALDKRQELKAARLLGINYAEMNNTEFIHALTKAYIDLLVECKK